MSSKFSRSSVRGWTTRSVGLGLWLGVSVGGMMISAAASLTGYVSSAAASVVRADGSSIDETIEYLLWLIGQLFS